MAVRIRTEGAHRVDDHRVSHGAVGDAEACVQHKGVDAGGAGVGTSARRAVCGTRFAGPRLVEVLIRAHIQTGVLKHDPSQARQAGVGGVGAGLARVLARHAGLSEDVDEQPHPAVCHTRVIHCQKVGGSLAGEAEASVIDTGVTVAHACLAESADSREPLLARCDASGSLEEEVSEAGGARSQGDAVLTGSLATGTDIGGTVGESAIGTGLQALIASQKYVRSEVRDAGQAGVHLCLACPAGAGALQAHLVVGDVTGRAVGQAGIVQQVVGAAGSAVGSGDRTSGAIPCASNSHSRNIHEPCGHVVKAGLVVQDVAQIAGHASGYRLAVGAMQVWYRAAQTADPIAEVLVVVCGAGGQTEGVEQIRESGTGVTTGASELIARALLTHVITGPTGAILGHERGRAVGEAIRQVEQQSRFATGASDSGSGTSQAVGITEVTVMGEGVSDGHTSGASRWAVVLIVIEPTHAAQALPRPHACATGTWTLAVGASSRVQTGIREHPIRTGCHTSRRSSGDQQVQEGGGGFAGEAECRGVLASGAVGIAGFTQHGGGVGELSIDTDLVASEESGIPVDKGGDRGGIT